MDKHSRCLAACQRGCQVARWCLRFPFLTLFSSSIIPRQSTTSACIYRRFLRSVRNQSGDMLGTQLRKQGAASASGLHWGHSIFADARLCTLPQSAEVLLAVSKCFPTCQSVWLLACRHLVFLCPRTISLATLPGALTYNTTNMLTCSASVSVDAHMSNVSVGGCPPQSSVSVMFLRTLSLQPCAGAR